MDETVNLYDELANNGEPPLLLGSEHEKRKGKNFCEAIKFGGHRLFAASGTPRQHDKRRG